MYIEIVTPEAVLFRGEVKSLRVPGVKGSFQILENHAPIISALEKGIIDIDYAKEPEVFLDSKFTREKNVISLNINSGTIEHKDNHSIVLVE